MVFPNSHYATTKEKMEKAIVTIEQELKERIKYFKDNNKLIEAQRIEERTNFDIEMMRETGFCQGIENYSRHISGRAPGSAPYTLFDYFPKDFLLLIDESHATIPQVRAMYNGDRARKESLVKYGFRLPSAFDNRPLKFEEFEQRLNQVIFVSATPAEYEKEYSKGNVVEQIIRPTGLLDPKIEVKPVENQIDALIEQIRLRVEKKEIKKAEITKYEVEGTRIISETKIKNNEEEYRIKYLYTEAEIIGFEIEQKNIRSYYIYEKDLEHNIVGLYEMNDYCGTRVASYIYDAYGNHKVLDKNKEENKAKNFIGNMNPIRYKGYYYDVETGLFFCNSRYYNPEWGRFLQVSNISSLNPSSINGLNLYVYANNNPVGISYSSSSYGGSAGGGMVSAIGSTIGGGSISGGGTGGFVAGTSGLSISFPSQNWVSLGIDLTAGMSGALSVLGWTMKNPEFYEFWYTAYGISKNQILNNLKSPMTKFATAISYGLVGHDTYVDVMGHINAGDSWQTTASSGIVTASVGALNVWASTKAGAAIGSAIGGVPGFLIGTAAGVVVGVVINGIFYTEINGKSIAGHIEDGIEWFLEWIS